MRGIAWAFVGVLVVVCLLAVADPATADQCCSVKKERFDSYPIYPNTGENCNVYNLAQSFTATESYTLCRVDVVLGPGGGPVTLYVQNGPLPGATVYTQGSIVVTGGERWYRFDVPNFDLVAGQTYYLRVTGEILWRRTTENIDYYANGQAYFNGVATPNDFWFRTYTWTHCVSEECSAPMDEFSDYPLFPNMGANCYFYVLAQSFRPLEDYPLCGVCVILNTGGDSDATLYIQDTPDANPNVIYASASRDDIGAEGWYCFDFAECGVSAGETYYIRVTSPSPGVLWRSYQDTSGGDPYPRGGAYQDGVLLDDVAPGHIDHWFICFTLGETIVSGTLEEVGSSWGMIKAMYR